MIDIQLNGSKQNMQVYDKIVKWLTQLETNNQTHLQSKIASTLD